MVKELRWFIIFVVLVLMALPVVAQEATDEAVIQPEATETVVDVPVVGDVDADPMEAEFLAVAMLIAGGIGVTVSMLVMGAISIVSLQKLGVSVPPEAFEQLGLLADKLRTGIATLEETAEKTDTPFDDIGVTLAKIPTEMLLQYLGDQGYTVDVVPEGKA